ncbi:MAG: sugar ABC transporter permease [Bauldia sp.]|uniref:carbohydrate ABC transporter permease n=1 Tax=Bauldia sp. TaxID=2575872 RepID=UPI001DE1FDFF|nr:sugar ABC transporter permease [Bauldia sp.]MCB1497813.1 sugar ABC transporter permease [Bauldia sp.]
MSDTTLAGSSASRPSFQGIGIARATYWWFLAPATTLAVLLVILPLVALIVMTFLRWNLTESPIPAFAGVDNYLRLFADGAFWASVGRTLVFTAESIILQLALGIAIAVLFNRDWFGMGVIRALFLAPMMVAPIFAGMIWRLLFSDDFGLIRYVILLLGFEQAPLWLGDPNIALQAVIIVNVWQWTAFVVLFILAGLQVISPDLYEAATIDGAGPWTRFWKITIPLLSPIIIAVIIFRAIDAMKVLDIVYVLTAGGPGNSTETVSYRVYQTGITFFELGYASTMALFVLLTVFVMAYLLLLAGRKRS